MNAGFLALAASLLAASGSIAVQSAEGPARDAVQRPEVPPPTATERAAIAARALALDPRLLPRAEAGHWQGFDPDRLAPTDLPRGFVDALGARERGDLPLAIDGLHAALRERPDFPPASHQLGVVYFKLQRYADALACFQRFLDAVPARVGETRGLAHALYSLGRYEEARAHYERVLAAAPEDTEALRGLALARHRLGDSAAALADLERVLASEPKHADAWTWKSQVLLDLERPEDARAAAQRARDLAPWSPRAWFVLGQALSELGREAEARVARERFGLLSRADQEIRRIAARLEHDPHDLALRRQLVELRASIGDRDAVRTDIALLVRERPGDVALRILALDVLDRLGDLEAAMLAARELERVGAESVAAWKRLEAWYGRIRDRVRQIEAGERWRRLGG